MRTSVLLAATGGTAATMLLAVAATGGLAALTDEDDAVVRVAETTEAPQPKPEAPVVKDIPVLKPVVLPSGAPACGNVMTKFASPRRLSNCATIDLQLNPAAIAPNR